jgi:hypothetical protein
MAGAEEHHQEAAMNAPSKQPTAASRIRLPISYVTLQNLKTEDGEPVTVQCRNISALLTAERAGSLPGGRPRTAADVDAEDVAAHVEAAAADPELAQKLARVIGSAPRAIEAGTALVDDDGSLIRPAFAWPGCPNRHPKSIDGDLLTDADIMILLADIYALSGWIKPGEDGAGGAGFHAGERDGGAHGLGAAPAGASDGPDGVGNPA